MTNYEAQALREEVAGLRQDVEQLRTSIRDLVDAWRLATGLLKAIKIIAAIAGGLAAISTLLHFGPKGH